MMDKRQYELIVVTGLSKFVKILSYFSRAINPWDVMCHAFKRCTSKQIRMNFKVLPCGLISSNIITRRQNGFKITTG